MDLWSGRAYRPAESLRDHHGYRSLGTRTLSANSRGAAADQRAPRTWSPGRVTPHAATHRERRRRSLLGGGDRRRPRQAFPTVDALREVWVAVAVRLGPLRAEGESLSAGEDVLCPQGLHRFARRPEASRRRRGPRALPPRMPRRAPRRLPVALVRSQGAERLQRNPPLLRERRLASNRKSVGAL